MQRLVLLVLGMASLVASGVIMDRGRVGLNVMGGLGLQTVQGVRGGYGAGYGAGYGSGYGAGYGAGYTLSGEELLKQKFILDIFQNIYAPLQQQELLHLADASIIANEDLYVRPLTQEMQLVLDLIQSQQMLGKQSVCSINNEQHVRQAVGLYRLFVNARDFDTFKRLVVYARQYVNNEMFVHCLVLSLGERQDTQMLIVPALYEILPQLFIKDHVIDQVQQLDTGVSSLRPQLMDVMGMGRRNLFFNSQFANQQQQQQQPGLFGILNKSQLWMPWRELHKQIAYSKMQGGNVVQQYNSQVDKVVINIPGNGLLSQDIGLKSYVGLLVDEILLNQDTVRKSYVNYNGIAGQESETNEFDVFGRRGQRFGSQYGNTYGGRQFNTQQEDYNSQYVFPAGKRFHSKKGFEVNEDVSRNNYYSGRQQIDIDADTTRYPGKSGVRNYDEENESKVFGNNYYGYNRNEQDLMFEGKYANNRLGYAQEYDTPRYMQQGQRGVSTVSINDPRLLFVGRRRKNPNNVVNMSGSRYGMGNSRYEVAGNQYGEDDDEFIAGGRRVSNERKNEENQKSKYNRNEDYNTNNERYGKSKITGNDNEKDNYYANKYGNKNSKKGYQYYQDNDYDQGENSKENYQAYKGNDYINRYPFGAQNYQGKDYYNAYNYGQGYGQGYGQKYGQTYGQSYGQKYGQAYGQGGINSYQDRDDFLGYITQGRTGQYNAYDNDDDVIYNQDYIGRQYSGESLDKHLPTTDINDERLLYINRHKLNNVVEGRRVSPVQGVFDNDDDEDVNYRYNTGYPSYSGYQSYPSYQRGAINPAAYNSYLDEQNILDVMQGGKQNSYANQQETYRGDKHGHRNRRSVVNKELGQTSTINGKLVLYSLQQLVARLNIERIALGQPLLIENYQNSLAQGNFYTTNLIQRTNARNVDAQAISQIQNIIAQIQQVLQQRLGQITIPSYNQKINEIGLILAGQIQELGLTNILGDILQIDAQQRKGLVVNMLENEAAQILLAGIVQVVDQRLQQIYLQREEFINTVQGITINNVGVDKLQTFVEQTEVDLTNLLQANIEQTKQGQNKIVVGRVPRLNHKSFKVEIDVTSDRQQQVVIRQLLVPQVDGQNNIIPLNERRQNVIVLDVTTAELQQGLNSLKLNSKDITITSRDTTPFYRIYQQVMQALNGGTSLQQGILAGQSSLLPHRLLLPRGRANGLPMQLITVITPLTGSSGIMGIQKGAELNTLFLDNLPLNYPLHCDLTNLNDVIAMPNLVVTDVKIYHEDNSKVSFY